MQLSHYMNNCVVFQIFIRHFLKDFAIRQATDYNLM